MRQEQIPHGAWALVGRWFVETDKGVRLYCEAVDERGPRFSYGPGNAVAVCPQWADFSLYFHDEKTGERW